MSSPISSPVISPQSSSIVIPSVSPLNPQLYNLLQRQFGQVRVSNPGEEQEVQYSPDPQQPGKLKIKSVRRGEQYSACCPFCGDERYRLYISYQYGRLDPRTHQLNDNLWFCQNEKCHEKPVNRMILRSKLYIPFPRQAPDPSRRTSLISSATTPVPVADPTFLPEELIPIHELSSRHPAVAYLLERNYDPRQLWEERRICFCPYSLNCRPRATNRLIIPFFDMPSVSTLENAPSQALLVGWQARSVPGLTNNFEAAPKYLTARGLKKGELLYGLSQAVHTPGPVFLCEGAADVWRAGLQAVGLLGNNMTEQQKQLLLRYFQGRPIIVLLDTDAQPEAHKILQELRTARRNMTSPDRVVLAQLPKGRKDPGECTRVEIFDAARMALANNDRVSIYPVAILDRPSEDQQGIPMPVTLEQLSLAAHLLNENAPFDLPNLMKRFLPDDELPVIESNSATQITQVINEAALIRQLWDQGNMEEQLTKLDLDFLYREIELPALKPLAAMMEGGVLFDVPKLHAHQEKYPTLIDSLIKHLSSTGRIHSQLDPISCSTGRILCSKPNLQAIPIDLRDAVIAQEDHVLLSADLSQFELRILAHFSEEPAFLDVYRSGCGDLHRYTASRLFELSLENIPAEERKLGKTVNFSLINGQTANGLADKLNIEITEAQIFIDDFYERYPQVASWINQTLQIAREQGYVTSLYGRRRHLPDLNSENRFKKAHAERQVVSGIIQATGADIFKLMLGRLSEMLPPEFQMILPIHDALLFEIPEYRVEEAKTLIREIMQELPPRFNVPLIVNIHVGRSWKA